MQEYGGLCHLCGLEVLGCTFEHYVSYSEAENFIGFLKQFLGFLIAVIQLFCHARELGSLTGEYECFLHFY